MLFRSVPIDTIDNLKDKNRPLGVTGVIERIFKEHMIKRDGGQPRYKEIVMCGMGKGAEDYYNHAYSMVVYRTKSKTKDI